MKKKFVLDTSIFVNSQTLHFFGFSPDEALENFLKVLEKKKNIECYMPPSVKDELLKFLSPGKINEKLLLRIKSLHPKKYELKVPVLFLYELIEDIRIRINKGLRLAEKITRCAIKGEDEETLIQRLRQQYRTALREGIIDSKEDLDLVILTRQLNAILVTEDRGLRLWAGKLGLETWGVKELRNLLEIT